MAAFSSSAQDAIERPVDVTSVSDPESRARVDYVSSDIEPYSARFDEYFDIPETATQILEGGYKRIALQFPDSLLQFSAPVYHSLRTRLSRQDPEAQLYILADTSYGSCCVDEVAAQHVEADALVHYGHACMSQQSRLPVIYIFTKQDVDISDCVAQLLDSLSASSSAKSQTIQLKHDVAYTHVADKIWAGLEEKLTPTRIYYTPPPKIMQPAPSSGLSQASRIREIDRLEPRSDQPTSRNELGSSTILYIGPEGPGLTYLLLTSANSDFHIYSPSSKTVTARLWNTTSKLLMRHYASIQKARDADVFGLLIGTLGVASYLPLLSDLRNRIRARHKKSYTISVGKLNPAKLANFMEIDCWVVVACREGSIGRFGDKEFFKPIVTPFELLHALTPAEHDSWTGEYSLEFEDILQQDTTVEDQGSDVGKNSDDDRPVFSLTSGKYRQVKKYTNGNQSTPADAKGKLREEESSYDLVANDKEEVVAIFERSSAAAQFLHSRQYQGLDSRTGQDAPSLLEQGRKGLAKGYSETEG